MDGGGEGLLPGTRSTVVVQPCTLVRYAGWMEEARKPLL